MGDLGVGLRAPASQVRCFGQCHSKVGRIQGPLGCHAVTEFQDPCGTGQGHLVQAVVAGHQPGVRRAADPEDLQHSVSQCRISGPDDLSLRLARMGQRAQDVEHGRDAQPGPDGTSKAHCWMKRPGEGEPDPVLGDLDGQAVRGDLDVYSEGLQQVEGS